MFAIVEKGTKKCHGLVDHNFIGLFQPIGIIEIIEVSVSGLGQISTDKGYIHTLCMTKIGTTDKFVNDAIMIRDYSKSMTLQEAEEIVFNND